MHLITSNWKGSIEITVHQLIDHMRLKQSNIHSMISWQRKRKLLLPVTGFLNTFIYRYSERIFIFIFRLNTPLIYNGRNTTSFFILNWYLTNYLYYNEYLMYNHESELIVVKKSKQPAGQWEGLYEVGLKFQVCLHHKR